jgi:Ca-activated chloride channel family protein
MLPYQPAGTYLAGRLHLSSTLSNGQPESVSADVVVTYADQPNHNVVPEVANIVERVTAHRLRTSAEQDLAAGEIGRATMKLKNAATRLLDLGELELGQETQQLALDVERLGGVSAAGQMALKHGTRKLTGKLTL